MGGKMMGRLEYRARRHDMDSCTVDNSRTVAWHERLWL